MKKLYTLLAAVVISLTASAQSTTITKWDFDASNNTPTTGTGTITLIGGVAPADPAYVTGWTGTATGGFAFNTTTYPDQGTNSGTAGFKFAVSTAGYTNITATLDRRGSNTSSKWEQYEYSTNNGTTWTVIGNNNGALLNSYAPITITFPAAANNSAGFQFRIVSIFAPSTTAYAPISGTYGAGGTWRMDNVVVSGTVATASLTDNAIAGLKVYPNPVSGNNFYISSDASAIKSVAVYDVLGKQVINTQVENEAAINVSNLNAGVYIVKITEEGKTATRKLVIK
ncbi:MAG TPA: T9SS type A sorting domain-containing protein [Flavobacterium sp.]|nr:T9SS type A sorting domain-containing protein [Flavobacterium sp.]